MSLVLDELPSDPDRLLLMLQQMAEVIAQHNASLASLQAERDAAQTRYEVAQAEIEKLWLLIRQLQRGQFGRRSERLDPDQLQLGLEDLEQTAAAAEAAQEAASRSSGTPRPPGFGDAIWAPCRRTCRGSRSWSTSRTRAVPAAVGRCI